MLSKLRLKLKIKTKASYRNCNWSFFYYKLFCDSTINKITVSLKFRFSLHFESVTRVTVSVILAYWQVFFIKQNFSLTPLLKLQLNQLTEALFHFCSHKVAILILICYFCLFSLHQAVCSDHVCMKFQTYTIYEQGLLKLQLNSTQESHEKFGWLLLYL